MQQSHKLRRGAALLVALACALIGGLHVAHALNFGPKNELALSAPTSVPSVQSTDGTTDVDAIDEDEALAQDAAQINAQGLATTSVSADSLTSQMSRGGFVSSLRENHSDIFAGSWTDDDLQLHIRLTKEAAQQPLPFVVPEGIEPAITFDAALPLSARVDAVDEFLLSDTHGKPGPEILGTSVSETADDVVIHAKAGVIDELRRDLNNTETYVGELMKFARERGFGVAFEPMEGEQWKDAN